MKASQAPEHIPEALLFVATGCAYCPAVLDVLVGLLKAGELRRLEVVNIAIDPHRAGEYGVRGVPWLRLGPFELEGTHSRAELERWARGATDKAMWADYAAEMLTQGRMPKVLELVRREQAWLPVLFDLLVDEARGINVHIGVSAVCESLAGEATLRAQIPRLAELLRDPRIRVRADAAHILGLSGDPSARDILKAAREDADPEVREIIEEALTELA